MSITSRDLIQLNKALFEIPKTFRSDMRVAAIYLLMRNY